MDNLEVTAAPSLPDLLNSVASEAPTSNLPEGFVIRGDGDKKIYGLSNKFCTNYPTELVHYISRSEYQAVIARINNLLEETLSTSFQWYVCACLSFCCTLDCVICPSAYFANKAIEALKLHLEQENCNRFRFLGFRCTLCKETPTNSEYVLAIEFISKGRLDHLC